MDPTALLRRVSDAYRNLKTLAIEASIITESGDQNSNQRSEQRVRFFYAAPDRIRSEALGKAGIIQVSDGEQLHTTFRNPGFEGGSRSTSIPLSQMHRLPHLFRPDFPLAGGDEAFLYQGIDERVAAAQILREENGCHVISVIYEPSPYADLVVSGPAVLFWVNAENGMVMRTEGELGHRFPAEEEITWTRHIVAVRQIRVDEPLPDDTFHFTPPPDATAHAAACGVSMSGGGGFVEHGADGQSRLEHRGSHEWDGDTLVEHSKWKIRGMTLLFERRLTFSADDKQLHVGERITGPKGDVRTGCDVPLA